jgi:hypothetical protein
LWPVAALLAALSVACDRWLSPRLSKFAVVFCFLTANLWSLKVGSQTTYLIGGLRPELRFQGAMVALALVLLLSALFARTPTRFVAVDQNPGRFLQVFAGLTLIGLLGLLDPAPRLTAPPSEAPNVILINFDGMSARHMSLYGYSRETTPYLDSLARECWVFDNYHSNFNSTTGCLPAMDGRLPRMVDGRIQTNAPGMLDLLPQVGITGRAYFGFWAPEVFLHRKFFRNEMTRSGKRSPIYKMMASVVPNRSLIWVATVLSEDARYYWPYTSDFDEEAFWRTNHYPGELSLEAALDYLEDNPTGNLVWIHLWEPHHPYWPDQDLRDSFAPMVTTPPRPINIDYGPQHQPFVDALTLSYDQTVLTTDRLVGRFVEALKQKGLYDNSYLVVTSDHGESFQGGYLGHSGSIVNEAITSIPLLIHQPGQTRGERVPVVCSQLDLAPTLLDMLGLKELSALPGESLVPYLSDPSRASDRVRFSVSYNALRGARGDIALYYRNYKVIYNNYDQRTQLYDLSKDPNTEHNLAAQHPDLVQEIMTKADAR